MSVPQHKPRTILHFTTDNATLTLPAWFLDSAGYCVLQAENGFEAIELAAREPVEAVVLELDRNHAEVALVAREIKRLRPQIPIIMITEATIPLDGLRELADALVPRENAPDALVESLQKLLPEYSGAPC